MRIILYVLSVVMFRETIQGEYSKGRCAADHRSNARWAGCYAWSGNAGLKSTSEWRRSLWHDIFETCTSETSASNFLLCQCFQDAEDTFWKRETNKSRDMYAENGMLTYSKDKSAGSVEIFNVGICSSSINVSVQVIVSDSHMLKQESSSITASLVHFFSTSLFIACQGQKDYSKPAQRTVSLASIQDVLDEIRDALESWTSRDFAFKNRRIFMTLWNQCQCLFWKTIWQLYTYNYFLYYIYVI